MSLCAWVWGVDLTRLSLSLWVGEFDVLVDNVFAWFQEESGMHSLPLNNVNNTRIVSNDMIIHDDPFGPVGQFKADS